MAEGWGGKFGSGRWRNFEESLGEGVLMGVEDGRGFRGGKGEIEVEEGREEGEEAYSLRSVIEILVQDGPNYLLGVIAYDQSPECRGDSCSNTTFEISAKKERYEEKRKAMNGKRQRKGRERKSEKGNSLTYHNERK